MQPSGKSQDWTLTCGCDSPSLSQVPDLKLGHLYEVLSVVKIMKTESVMVVARARAGGGNAELLFSRFRVSVLQDLTKKRL